MYNQNIRRTAAGAGVKLRQTGDAPGIAGRSLSRRLPLPAGERERISGVIRELSKEAV